MWILHIGSYKTGSTAIQHALSANRETLACQGFCYPRPGIEQNHGDVARLLMCPKEASATVRAEAQRIRDEARAASGNVIISSEGFASVRPALLREWCGGVDVRIIVYLREQAEAIASQYQQHVKATLVSTTFETFAEPRMLDYAGLLTPWAAAFGRENLSAHAYAGGDAVAHFAGLIGVEPADWRPLPADPNPSIAGALLEAKRRLNARLQGSADEMMRLTWHALLELANAEPRYRGRVAASDALLADIRNRHRETNAALAERLGVVFPEREWIAPSFDESDVREALAELVRRRPALADVLTEAALA